MDPQPTSPPPMKDLDGVTEIDVQKYGKYYNMFFATGLASLLILIGLFMYLGNRKY